MGQQPALIDRGMRKKIAALRVNRKLPDDLWDRKILRTVREYRRRSDEEKKYVVYVDPTRLFEQNC